MFPSQVLCLCICPPSEYFLNIFLDRWGEEGGEGRAYENHAITRHLKILLFDCKPLTNTNIPYILESNSHSVFGDFLNEKKLVRGSNPHLSFNRPLPTG
jgi:hypothetical protein